MRAHCQPAACDEAPGASSAPTATRLADWRDRHAGGTVIVCGCGRSLGELPHADRFITVGVNDVGRLFDPTYLVVLNPKSQFAGDRFGYVQRSRANALFTQLDLRPMGVAHPCVVRFRLGRRGGTDLSASDTLPYTRNSPYVAVCLAAFMGATRIGLIGVDFTDHHFFAADGRHPLARELATIDREYAALAAALAQRGVELVNLSRESRLTALPKVDPEPFLAGTARAGTSPVATTSPSATPRLNVVSYATTPVAGVPAVLARCIAARTPHTARCVWADCTYGNGVTFDGDVEWRRSPRDAEAALVAADLVIVHNGRIDARHERLLASKPVVTMAHNYAWNVDARFVARGLPGVVVGQYQATLAEFARWSVVPNPMPIWETAFTPAPKPRTITLCYTPSGRHERYPEGHRLYWHAKGYETTMRVLDRLAARWELQLEVIRGGQLSHAESLAMKRRAHIVIDECVTGSYHRNSLEGLAAGCVVVNGVGILPAVADVLRRCTPGADRLPFTFSRLENLEATLDALIALGADGLEAAGAVNRKWMEQHWEFGSQWERFWQPAVAAALERRQSRPAAPRSVSSGRSTGMRVARRPTASVDQKVSVVIPHGGTDRLPQLTATLASLRQRAAIGEIIVAEMGQTPAAEAIAGRWADKYVFVSTSGGFERARALNVGSGVAECALVLWNDNDLVTGTDFVARAVKELVDRRLDYLIPYSTVRYLSEQDSGTVVQGVRDPSDCAPVSLLYSGRRKPACSGGAGLVTRDFLLRYGGLIEGFVGWGGEDNAWNRKVALLGRSGTTLRADQHAYHLFHPSSAGYRGHAPNALNPHYASNLALLGRIWTIKDPRQLLRQFPPTPRRCPWDPARPITVVTDNDDAARHHATMIAGALRSLYGARLNEAVLSPANGWHEQCASADAILVFGGATAAELRKKSQPALQQRCLIVLEGDEEARPGVESPEGTWAPTIRLPAPGADPTAAAISLVGPLSMVLAGVTPAAPARAAAVTRHAPTTADSSPTPPVWVYWEGVCPGWVESCRKTIAAHAPEVRMLTPDGFDRLRDCDRDIDLSRLQAPQRADFIRAFLLARYGGMWIDADCLVMQPLQPVLDLLRHHDFVAHRERSGLVSNGFIAARPDSRCASAFYQRVCQVLRSRRPLGWTSLGSEPLTEELTAHAGQWYELPCDRVQPICWSDPGAFFARGPQAVHEQRFDPHALCYMLSNTEITKHMKAGAGRRLTDTDTFFTFLVNTSLRRADRSQTADEHQAPHATAAVPEALQSIFAGFADAYRQYGDESLSGPGSCLAHTSELRERLPLLLADLDIHRLVDAPCGDFNWMRHVGLGLSEYVGVDILPDVIAESQRRYGNDRRRFLCLDIRTAALPAADCILCRDCLVHLSLADIHHILRNFRSSGAKYLLTTTFTGQRPNHDTSRGEWRTLNLELPPFGFPTPIRVINEKCSEAGGAYWDKSLGLWRLADLPA